MLRPLVALSLLLATLVALPAASAAPACATGTDAPAYLETDGASFVLYQESNGLPGLQPEACEDGEGRAHPGDTRVASGPPPVRPCVGSICVI